MEKKIQIKIEEGYRKIQEAGCHTFEDSLRQSKEVFWNAHLLKQFWAFFFLFKNDIWKIKWLPLEDSWKSFYVWISNKITEDKSHEVIITEQRINSRITCL